MNGNKSCICLLTLIGLPGCGKTTFSNYLSQCINDSPSLIPFNCVITVCYDKILSFHRINWNDGRKLIFASVNEMIENLTEHFDPESLHKYHFHVSLCNKNYSLRRILIVIDDNMYYRSMRYKYFQLARIHNLGYCQIYIKCNIEECIKRNATRVIEEKIPDDVIYKMASNLEEPNAAKYTWETLSLCIPSSSFSVSFVSVCKIINEAFIDPASTSQSIKRDQEQEVSISNVVHQIDLLLRKIIRNEIQRKRTCNLPEMKDFTASLSLKKQIIMQEIKTHKILIPKEIEEGIKEGNDQAKSALESLLQNHFDK